MAAHRRLDSRRGDRKSRPLHASRRRLVDPSVVLAAQLRRVFRRFFIASWRRFLLRVFGTVSPICESTGCHGVTCGFRTRIQQTSKSRYFDGGFASVDKAPRRLQVLCRGMFGAEHLASHSSLKRVARCSWAVLASTATADSLRAFAWRLAKTALLFAATNALKRSGFSCLTVRLRCD
jgi:hypothetical protein